MVAFGSGEIQFGALMFVLAETSIVGGTPASPGSRQ